jgi:hypothetical protein
LWEKKEETSQHMENLRKKNGTDLQNKTEGQSSRIEQTEDRISELQDEMVTKGKTEELLNSRLVKRNARTHQLHQKTKLENHGH